MWLVRLRSLRTGSIRYLRSGCMTQHVTEAEVFHSEEEAEAAFNRFEDACIASVVGRCAWTYLTARREDELLAASSRLKSRSSSLDAS